MPEYEIDIAIEEARWLGALPDTQNITHIAVENALNRILSKQEHVEISVVLANDDFIQDLNATYRGKDKPTNVLSFPQTERQDLKSQQPFLSLGDIIIAFETIEREASEQNKSLQAHFTHMLVHGCLHLLHYDHETDAEAEQMEGLEIEILDDLGIKNPYETV